MNNRFLIGMPGCGKSTVAAVFDWKYDEQVYDTDDCIVSKHGEISKFSKNTARSTSAKSKPKL